MTGTVRIGCSGWIYRHWRELFYPAKLPQRLWFDHYAATFSTVELNTSFYHLPRPESFAKWRDQAPPGFRYAVKAPRFITHMKKLKDCAEPVGEFLGRARKLGKTIGPVLYQLPPRWALNRERLEQFIALLPADLNHVFEFREKSWLSEEVLALMDARGVSFCAHDMPGLATERWASGPVAMSDSTAAPANMSAAIPTRRCSPGPTGSSPRRGPAATPGAISTTTYTATPSTTPSL